MYSKERAKQWFMSKSPIVMKHDHKLGSIINWTMELNIILMIVETGFMVTLITLSFIMQGRNYVLQMG